jgi:hypothetical protein
MRSQTYIENMTTLHDEDLIDASSSTVDEGVDLSRVFDGFFLFAA